MRKGGGGAKGRQFERDISRILSLWISDGINEDIFWRTDASGARATTKSKKGKSLPFGAGDIKHEEEEGKIFTDIFLVEVKRGYGEKIDFLNFIDKPKTKNIFLDWFNKAQKECDFHNKKVPLIIFKRNNGLICAAFSNVLYNMPFAKVPLDCTLLNLCPHHITITTLDTFLYKVLDKEKMQNDK